MPGYYIDRNICIQCGACQEHCPFSCIENSGNGYEITEGCQNCGLCSDVCPVGAVIRQDGEREVCDTSAWKNILVYFEYHYGKIHPVGYQLLGKAFELALSSGCDVYGIVIGENLEPAREQLRKFPLKSVFLCDAKEHFTSDEYTDLLCDCIGKLRPSIVLIGGTAQGKSLAPCAATRFRTGLTADCTDLSIRDGDCLVQTRPAFGGNIMAQIVTLNTRPQFATVRLHMMKPAQESESADVEFIESTPARKLSSVFNILEVQTVRPVKDITQQKVLVVAGKGVKKKEDLEMLSELAVLLGGELASTRGLVEKGWIKSDRQIGLSGHTVRPKLLIACGVSGSVQFMAGMKGAENIIAINQDPDARIFQIAHCPICADLYDIIPALIQELTSKGGAR